MRRRKIGCIRPLYDEARTNEMIYKNRKSLRNNSEGYVSVSMHTIYICEVYELKSNLFRATAFLIVLILMQLHLLFLLQPYCDSPPYFFFNFKQFCILHKPSNIMTFILDISFDCCTVYFSIH